MLNINELERQWQEYKKRRLRPYIYTTAASLMILVAGVYFWPSAATIVSVNETQPKPVTVQPAPKPAVTPSKPAVKKPIVPEPVQTPIAPTVVKQVQQPDAVVKQTTTAVSQPQSLEPSFGFMQQIRPQNAPTRTYKKPAKTKRKTSTKKAKKTVSQPKSKTPVAITSTATDDKMNALIKRFSQSHNPALGIVIAKLYYEKRIFKLSYKFALEVNAIDETNIQSWLIAAKSLYKLGKKDDAMSMLESYIQKTHSSSAHKVLRQMRQGSVE